MNDLPIACSLTDDERDVRRADLLPGLLADVLERRAAASGEGYAARFAPAPGRLAQLARVIEAERACCRFLRFTLTAEPNNGALWLEVTGPPGTRAFLDSVFQPAP